jgi:hypothetical protein
LRCYIYRCQNIHDGKEGAPRPFSAAIENGEFKMNVISKFWVASVLALSIAAPVQAQNQKQGDYYAPGPTTPIHLTPGQEMKLKDGDYYAGDTMILNHKRMAALKKCTEGKKFAGDKYVACMTAAGEAP